MSTNDFLTEKGRGACNAGGTPLLDSGGTGATAARGCLKTPNFTGARWGGPAGEYEKVISKINSLCSHRVSDLCSGWSHSAFY